MFLRPLNNEQKELFLSLALAAASANNVLEDSERALLAAYADEMSIDVNKASQMPVEQICRKLKEISNSKELNQISFEIVGMMMSDNEYDDDEKAFISKIAEIFEIPLNRIDEMFSCVNAYSELIKKINVLMYE
jgi:RNase H-fold protein (predicted Holliday junction resolvase)